MSERSGQKFDRLNAKNYSTWSVWATAMLKKRNLWNIVSGDTTRPLGSENSKAVKAFVRGQEEACAEIILCVDPSQLSHCRTDDPAEMWNNLAEVHRAHGFASRLRKRREFIFMQKDENIDMQTWIGNARSLAFECIAIGSTVTDEDLILVLTQGLPPKYDSFVTSLDSTNPSLLTVPYVIERLMGAESQIESRRIAPTALPVTPPDDQPGAALVAHLQPLANRVTPIEKITCFRCGNKGHYQRNCSLPDPHPGAAHAAIVLVASPAPIHAHAAFAGLARSTHSNSPVAF